MSRTLQWTGIALVFVSGTALDHSLVGAFLIGACGMYLLVSELAEGGYWRWQAEYWRNQWTDEQQRTQRIERQRTQRIVRDCRSLN